MNEIEPKVLTADHIASLLADVQELPAPDGERQKDGSTVFAILSANEAVLLRMIKRLAEALAGEHLTANLTRHQQDNLFPDALPHHNYIKRLVRLADTVAVSLQGCEDNHDLDLVQEIAIVIELRDALKREMRLRRSKDAPHPCTPIDTDGISPLARQILWLLNNYCLSEARLSDGCGYPLVDALTTTDETIAQGEREIAALAGHLAAALEEWLAVGVAEYPAVKSAAMKMAGCDAAKDDPAEFRHRAAGPAFDRAKMEAAIDEEMRFFRAGKDRAEWTRRRQAAAVAAEGFIFKMVEFGYGPVAAAAGAVAAAAKVGGGFTDKDYLKQELELALSVGLAASPKVSEEERLAALHAVAGNI